MADNKLTKSIGEHWVCAELARRGWAPALTRDGLERTDILAVATHLPDRPAIEVQVKTATGGHGTNRWILGTKAQSPAINDREWFVLVLIPPAPAPLRGFVAPRDHVAAGAWIAHMSWLTDPDAAPGTRNTPPELARVAAWVFNGYEDRWDLLANPAGEAPVLLPAAHSDLMRLARVGLPPDHPWSAAPPRW